MRTPFTLLAGTAALGLSLLALPTAPAAAQSAPTAPAAGGFADARGIVVDLTALTAVDVPGPLSGSPLDPNTFGASSHACPPRTPAPAPDVLLDVPASPAATARTVSASAVADCSAPKAVSVAQIEGATALVNAGVPLITADVLRAQANSDCATAPNGEGSLFAGLKVNGTAVPLGPLGVPEPNTRIDVPGLATVIVNEQHPTAAGRGIVVNAVHVIGASPLLRGDLILGHAVSGVVCPNGKGAEVGEGLASPDITFAKSASPTTARPGDTVTYTATVRNTSDSPCDVLSFVDHLHPALSFVSTSGAFGSTAVDPVAERSDGGQDVVVKPSGVVLAPGASAVQKIVVEVEEGTAPGTYFNNLELFCAVNGDFASGPLAPVTVPAPAPAPTAPAAPEAPAPGPAAPPVEGGGPAEAQLPATGAPALLGGGALLLLLASLGVRRTLHG